MIHNGTAFSTVAAVSTPRGKGGIATVRISGDDTLRILDKCFVPKGRPLCEREWRQAIYGEIVKDGRVIDTGICTLFEKGKSFTGECMAELSCHGGIFVTREVLETVLAAGADAAGPGEFTRRAFINGKLSLSEAEAVGRLIDADTKSKRELASGAVRGNLTGAIENLDKKLYDVMTALWAAVDYPEEDVGSEGEDNIYPVVCDVLSGVLRLSATYRTGRAVAEGVRTVICGKPNVGKSSLYNAMVGSDRAIVTDIAGTTRDVLEDTVDIGGVTLILTDTAGLRQSEDAVEKIGIERARAKIEEAELVICLFDLSSGLAAEEYDLIRFLGELPAAKICVLNKMDKKRRMSGKETDFIKEKFEKVIYTDASRGEGLSGLTDAVSQLYNSEKLVFDTDAVIWDSLQKASLDRTAELLSEAKKLLEDGAPLDAVGVLCEDALSNMRMTDGRDVSEDIISGIFSRFCVGK